MYNIENMPKYKAMKTLKKKWETLKKQTEDTWHLEEEHASTYNLPEYQTEAMKIRHLNTLAGMATSFYLYALDIMTELTTQEELEEMKKMTANETATMRKTINFYNELRETAKEASTKVALLRKEHRNK